MPECYPRSGHVARKIVPRGGRGRGSALLPPFARTPDQRRSRRGRSSRRRSLRNFRRSISREDHGHFPADARGHLQRSEASQREKAAVPSCLLYFLNGFSSTSFPNRWPALKSSV